MGGEPVGHEKPPENTRNLGAAPGGTTPSTRAANVSTRPAAPGSLLARIAGTPVQPLAVGRSVRLATTAQRQALRVRDGGCVIPGCDIDATYTQPHHVIGWAIGGTTDLDALVSLCWVHHRLTELGRFTFTPKTDDTTRPAGSIEHAHWWITPPVKAPA